MEIKDGRTVSVLMFPWLAHGHICPFLELAKRLTRKTNFYIYFCSTPATLSSINGDISHLTKIQFVELHLPSLPELPPHFHTTNGLPSHLMPTLKEAFDMSSLNFAKILRTLKPDLLIYDFLQPWAPAIAISMNIPAVEFVSSSASMTAVARHFSGKISTSFPWPEIELLDFEMARFARMLESAPGGIKDNHRVEECTRLSEKIILIKTFREIEGKYVDYLSSLIHKKVVPVGPLVKDSNFEEEQGNEIMNWLNQKEKSSVVFVSFGTEYFLSKEEMEEIAHGLELSKVDFIWVIRFPVGERLDLDEALPLGFMQRVAEKSMVVEDWALQRKILGHPSVGGFVSHCGWSSVMESMKLGVPIIGVPMNLDQRVNARVAQEVGVAVEVRRDSRGRLQREEVAKMIRKVVVEREGESVREKARELMETMRVKEDEEIEEVVDELLELLKD